MSLHQCAPLRGRRQRLRRGGEPLVQGRDQDVFLDPALQLPEPEADKDRHHHERESAKTQAGVFGERGHEQCRDRDQHQPGADGDAEDE